MKGSRMAEWSGDPAISWLRVRVPSPPGHATPHTYHWGFGDVIYESCDMLMTWNEINGHMGAEWQIGR